MERQRFAKDERVGTSYSDLIMSQIRQRLEEIADSQIRISSARKELLVKRERLRTNSRVVQLKRVDAGDAEAAFMSRVREFLNDHPGELTSLLQDAYEKVEKARDDLGEIEQNYLEDESDLTGAEWTFMDQEDRFYQWDIHSILPEENNADTAFTLGDWSETIPNTSAYSIPLPSTGSPSPNQFLPPPPPPPPPPLPPPPPTHSYFTSYDPVNPSSATDIDQGYDTMMAEVNTLKREFEQIRHKQACDLEWRDEQDVYLPGIDVVSDDSSKDGAGGSGDIVYDIFILEARAQRLKAEAMIQGLDTSMLTRRYSDPAHSIRPAPTCSTPMRRTQTEIAPSSLRDYPTVKQKIREWSLFHLKESAVHKQVYLNTLQEHGVSSPAEGDWRARATQYWNVDSSVESREGSERDDSSASGSEHEPRSCREMSVRQSVASPSSSWYLQEEDSIRDTGQAIVISQPYESREMLHEERSAVLGESSTLMPSSHHQAMANAAIDNGDRMTRSTVDISHDQQEKARECIGANALSLQTPDICPTKTGEAAERKDSVQTSSITTHPDHATARNHHDEIKAHHATAKHIAVEMTTGAATSDERGTQSQHTLLSGVHRTLPPTRARETDVHDPSDFGGVVQPASSAPCTQPPIPSAVLDETNTQLPDNSTTPDSRPISQGRRHTTTWLRNLLPTYKSKRSKSTSSIGGHHPLARFGKHPVA